MRYRGLMQMGEQAASDVGMSLASMSGTNTAAIRNNALGGAKYLSKNSGSIWKPIAQKHSQMAIRLINKVLVALKIS